MRYQAALLPDEAAIWLPRPPGARLFVTLFEPRVADVVITALFPEAGLVVRGEGNALQPFRAFPEIEARYDQADRTAMFAADGLAVMRVSEEAVLVQEVIDTQVRRVAVVTR